jgi:hypothetical protein
MRYKQTLKRIVADMFIARNTALSERLEEETVMLPCFYIMDSPEDKSLGLLFGDNYEGYFKRKMGEYGLIAEKGMFTPVGIDENKLRYYNVHIVDSEDLKASKKR